MANFIVADDSMIFRKTLVSVFQKLGHKVVGQAKDGIHAYIECEKNKPDAVTLDINMPIMSGLEIIPKISQSFPDIKIILISSSSKKSEVEQALKQGASGFLIKPITIKKVEQIIHKLL